MNITNIINEEIKSLLNEAYVFPDNGKNFFFAEQILKPSFFNFEAFSSDFDVDVTESNVWVKWHVGFWLKDEGIEGFFVEIDDVDGQYTVEMRNRQSDAVEQENVKEIKEIKWKFVVEEAVLPNKGALGITNVSFDFKTNICTIDF